MNSIYVHLNGAELQIKRDNFRIPITDFPHYLGQPHPKEGSSYTIDLLNEGGEEERQRFDTEYNKRESVLVKDGAKIYITEQEATDTPGLKALSLPQPSMTRRWITAKEFKEKLIQEYEYQARLHEEVSGYYDSVEKNLYEGVPGDSTVYLSKLSVRHREFKESFERIAEAFRSYHFEG